MGNPASRVSVQSDDFSLDHEVLMLRGGDAGVGAVAAFVGTVRDRTGAQVVGTLELEHYPGMTEQAIESMIDEAMKRFDIRAARVIHRVGLLQPCDQIVLVAVTSAHRGAAFQACGIPDGLSEDAGAVLEEGIDCPRRPLGRCPGRRRRRAATMGHRGNQLTGLAPMSKLIEGHEHLQRQLRTALGRFATGVTIVTCVEENGIKVGLTANSFSALSLDPPLVLWSLRSQSASAELFGRARHFAVNVLAETEMELAAHFASSATPDKFVHGVWHEGEGGVPVLDAAAATFECEMVSKQEVGDHLLFIGRVLRSVDGKLPPLIFHAGGFHRIGAAST